jgi:hypothetical protein
MVTRLGLPRLDHVDCQLMSTESIASSTSPSLDAGTGCGGCQAPLASDQRYCLECGERRLVHSEMLLAGPPSMLGDSEPRTAVASALPSALAGARSTSPSDGSPQRNNTLTVIAGVGVLLLAMGVGVLIGRSGSSKQSAVPAQVISVAAAPAAGGGASAGPTAEAPFTSDWPSGRSGYTVQLQTLPQTGTKLSSVEAAKRASIAKGAHGVGALKSEEFTSLTAGNYVIYAGVDPKKNGAEKALASLKKSFPGAKVIRVTNAAGLSGSSSRSGGSAGASKTGLGSSENKPAPPSVLEGLKNTKGRDYEEKSKDLPDVVSTG